MITNSFKGDLDYFNNLLKNKTPFSLTRYGDGERLIMEGVTVGNNEFHYDGKNDFVREELLHSIKLKKENYYVGIPCPCCQPEEKCEYMKNLSEKSDDKLTWANIFVNSNFNPFNQNFVKDFNTYDFICFIGRGNPSGLPFRVDKFYKVEKNAHIYNVNLLNELPKFIQDNNINNGLFIISAGPFANILCARMFEAFDNNTFIDIGSVFDVHQGLGRSRRYLMGAPTLNKVCVW